jgi:hypothetical protein
MGGIKGFPCHRVEKIKRLIVHKKCSAGKLHRASKVLLPNKNPSVSGEPEEMAILAVIFGNENPLSLS